MIILAQDSQEHITLHKLITKDSSQNGGHKLAAERLDLKIKLSKLGLVWKARFPTQDKFTHPRGWGKYNKVGYDFLVQNLKGMLCFLMIFANLKPSQAKPSCS